MMQWLAKPLLLALGLLLASASSSDAEGPGGKREPVSVVQLLGEMVDRASVARYPATQWRLRQQSSYNRASVSPDEPKGWFKNKDYNDNFLRVEKNNGRKEWVLMEHNGPGVLVRTWMPEKSANDKKPRSNALISIYLDGASEPTIEGPVLDLFNGTREFPYPLAHKSLLSAVSFFPIPYAKSCKITLTERPFFYIFTYREYPEETPVETYSPSDLQAAAELIDRTGATLLASEINATPAAGDRVSRKLEPQAEMRLNLPAGPAAVRELSLKLSDYEDPSVMRSVVLKIEFDGKPAVWSPIGDFFGSGVGLNPFRGWYRTVGEDGTLACRWVMPYRESARITVENLGDQPVDLQLAASTGDWEWDNRSLYFHAGWRQQAEVPTRPFSDWNYVELTGRGVYVGDTLTVLNPVAKWWGEGDAKIYVDGESFPSLFGTGTEDYYGYSWGGKSTDFYEHPFHAQPRAHVYNKLSRKQSNEKNTLGLSTETRTRALDTMPFGESLKVDMEVWHWTDCVMSYGVGVYWYGDAATTTNLRPDPREAINTPSLETATAN